MLNLVKMVDKKRQKGHRGLLGLQRQLKMNEVRFR